jgi:hypothetical protein
MYTHMYAHMCVYTYRCMHIYMYTRLAFDKTFHYNAIPNNALLYTGNTYTLRRTSH